MSRFAKPQRCLVRNISDSFDRCVRAHPAAIDISQARRQHAGYVAVLRYLLEDLVEWNAFVDHPDACFVEDVAVVVGDKGLVTRPGHPVRRGETTGVSDMLARWVDVVEMPEPATLDGGDVLRVGDALWVGLSSRTNVLGLEFLRDWVKPMGLSVEGIPIQGGLHLKSACTMVAEDALLFFPDLIDKDQFPSAKIERLEASEFYGANVLALGSDILVSAAAPRTAERLAKLGYRVHLVCVDEFHKADGALTCLSIRIPATVDAWSG